MILPDARSRWLAARRELVTASDVAAILGEDPRRGPLAVYCDKLGAEEQQETVPMRRGRRFEDAIAHEYHDQTGRPVGDLPEYEITRHPDLSWLGATLDRTTDGCPAAPDPFGGTVAESRDGRVVGRVPLQIKMAIGSARDWEEEPPLGYVVQVQVEMACAGSNWGALAALVGPGPLATVDLVRDDAFFAALIPALEKFRWHVEKRIPPEADAKPGTSAAIRRLWGVPDGATVALPDALDLVEQWEAAEHRIGAAKHTADELENKLRARLGSASFGALKDGSFLALPLQKRAGYTVAPTSFRVLRRMRPRVRR